METEPGFQVGEMVRVRNENNVLLAGARRILAVQPTLGGEFMYEVENTRDNYLPEYRLSKLSAIRKAKT